MFSNPFEMMQFFRQCKNPKDATLKMLEQQAQANPNYAALLSLAKAGNDKGVEGFVRDMMTSQGIDYDKEFNAFKKSWGFK